MLREKFSYPIGFSDHTFGYAIPLAAVSLGVCVIEKHFTIDKTLPGWDHEISADETELEIIVRESKNIALSMGKFERIISKAEEEKRKKFRRSLVVTRDMKAGDIIRSDDIIAKRPGTGIAPDQIDRIIGKKIKRDLFLDELLHEEDLL